MPEQGRADSAREAKQGADAEEVDTHSTEGGSNGMDGSHGVGAGQRRQRRMLV